MNFKLPPIEKIPEAYSAIMDERVDLQDSFAYVYSSNREKKYTVTFHDDIYASNDAATYWQGYPGYPILAVWMLQGKLPYQEELARSFQGIDWHALNQQYKRKYAQAVQSLYDEMDSKKVAELQKEIQHVYECIQTLPYRIQKNTTKVEKLK